MHRRLIEYFVSMRNVRRLYALSVLALAGMGSFTGCGGPPSQAKGGVQVALPATAGCAGKDCYSRDELNRFQRAASLYTRMYGMKTIDNRAAAVEGAVVVRCRVELSERGNPFVSSVAVLEQSVGTDDFLRRLSSVFEGARLRPDTPRDTVREYHLHFSRNVYYAQSALDTATRVILPALQSY